MPDNDTYRQPTVNTLEDARFWLGVMHRRTCSDIEHINALYERLAWLALPWWRRAFRKPPWL
jgi:hypothetical protein